MFKRKTVIDVLDKHNITLSDEVFPNIYRKFHREKCKSKVKSISYKELCQLRHKDPNNWLHIIQEDIYKDSIDSYWEMDPFKNAVIIVTANHCLFGIFYHTVRIFTYKPATSYDIIPLPNFSALKTFLEANSNSFYIYQYNENSGESSLVTQFENLNGNDTVICVSKYYPYIVLKY